MASASSFVGSSTCTGWNLRSSAGSFSIYLRYSSSVVAPITRISPRASAGLSMFDASIAPSEPPAPTIVCSSSMNRITLPLFCSSAMMFLNRSSNSPRYLLPATTDAISSETTRFPHSICGIVPSATRCASPSTIADLPTPGSPMSTGLFFVRRMRICVIRSISFSRPITGSSSPCAAARVRSRPY